LVDGSKFLEGMKHEHHYFALIPKISQEKCEDVLAEVSDMLEEF